MDPNATPEDLLRMTRDFPVEVLGNPGLPFVSLFDPAAWEMIRYGCMCAIVHAHVKAVSEKMSRQEYIDTVKGISIEAKKRGIDDLVYLAREALGAMDHGERTLDIEYVSYHFAEADMDDAVRRGDCDEKATYLAEMVVADIVVKVTGRHIPYSFTPNRRGRRLPPWPEDHCAERASR